MSKKIAQLTKVIYHLNTKNEDHQSAMNSLGRQHRNEIEEILSDAAGKIKKFKEELGKRKSQKAALAEINKLKKHHRAEKEAAMKHFEEYKVDVASREDDARTAYQSNLRKLQTGVEAVKEKFEKRVAKFKALASKHKSTVDQLRGMQADAKSSSESHKKEIEDLVRDSNQKYSDMLQKRLAEEDELLMQLKTAKEESEAQQKKLEKIEKELQNAEFAIVELRSALKEKESLLETEAGDKEEARRAHSESRAKQKEHMNKLMDDLQQEQQRASGLSSELETLKKELCAAEAAKADVERKLVAQKEALEALRKSSDESSTYFSDMKAELEKHTELLNGKVGATESLLHSKENDLKRAYERIDAVQSELDKERAKSANENEGHKAEIAAINAKLDAAKRSCDDTLKEGNKLEKKLSVAGEARKKLEKEAASLKESIKALNEKIDTLEQDIEKEKKRGAESVQGAKKKSKEALDSARKDAAKDLAALEAKMKAAESVLKKKISDMKEAHANDAKSTQAAHDAMMAALEKRHASARSKLEQEGKDSLNKLADRLEGKIADERERANQLSKKLLASNENAKELDSERKAHLADLKSAQNELEKRKKDADIESKKLESERESVRKLKESVALLEQKMEEELAKARKTLSAAKESAAQELKRKQGLYEEEIAAQRDAAAEARDHALDELRSTMDAAMDRLRAEAKAESERLQGAISDAEAKVSAGSDEIQVQRARHAGEIEKLRVEFELQTEKLRDESSAAMKLKEEKHAEHVKHISIKAKEARESDLASLRSELASAHEARVSALEHASEAAKVKAEKDLASAVSCKADELMQRYEKQMGDLKAALAQAHTEAMDGARAEHESALGKLNDQLQQKTADHRAIELALSEAQLDAQKRFHNWTAERERLVEDAKRKENDFRAQHLGELTALRAEHQNELKDANDAMRVMREQHEEKYASAQAECQDWRERFEARESRKEDVEKIRQLQSKVIAADKRVKEIQEEMKYFKLELMNREENFNKMFNASPNVGVMNIMRTKSSGLPAKNKKAGRSLSVSSQNNQKGFPPLGRNTNVPGGPPSGNPARRSSQPAVRRGR